MWAEIVVRYNASEQWYLSEDGKDSDVFRVRVAGDFPLQEDDVYIPLPFLSRNGSRGERLLEMTSRHR